MNSYAVTRKTKVNELILLATWAGSKRTGKMTLHIARWLSGRGRPTQPACNLDMGDFASVDVYRFRPFLALAVNRSNWCADCRAELDRVLESADDKYRPMRLGDAL